MHETFDWLTRLLAAECLLAAWGYAAFALATRMLPGTGIALRWTTAGVAGLWLVSVAFHLLLALSAFRLAPALAAAVAVAGVAYRTYGGLGPLRQFARDVRALSSRMPSGVRSRHVFTSVAAAGAALAVLATAARAALLPVVAWDSLTYHAVKSAMWVQLGGPLQLTAPGGFSIYRDYPGGGELLVAWAMLPLRSDLLTGALDAALWLLLGVAVHALGAQFSLSGRARWTGALYVLALPAAARAAGSLYVDNVLALTLVAACALALHSQRRGDPRALVPACMALGVGVGIKVFALPVAGAALLALGVVTFLGSGARRTLAGMAAGAAVFLPAAAPWFVGNVLRTGLPLSPFPVEVAGLTLGRSNPALAWYMDRPATRTAGFGDELQALARTFGVPAFTPLDEPTLGALSLLVALVAGVAWVTLARRDWRSALLTLAFVAPMVGSYFGAGLKNTRLLWAAVSGRYLLAAVALCVVLSLACCRGRGRWPAGYRWLLAIGAAAYVAVSEVPDWTRAEALVASGAAAAAFLLFVTLRRRPAAVVAGVVLPLVLVAGPGLLLVYREASRDHAREHSVALHASPRYWTAGMAAVDDPSRPRTVAVTAGASQDNDNWLLYPFLGRRFQNTLVYVPVTADGVIVDLAHNETRVARSDYDAWRGRLQAARVSRVVSFSPPSLELFWMERRPEQFRRVAGDGRRWGVYQVRGAGAED